MNDIEMLADARLLRIAEKSIEPTLRDNFVVVGSICIPVLITIISILTMNYFIAVIGIPVFLMALLVYLIIVETPIENKKIKKRHNELRKQYGLPTDDEE